MSSFRSREGTALSTLAAIIRGEPWTASSVRNPILRKHFRRLGRTFRQPNRITDSLREPCLHLITTIMERSDLLARPHPLQRHLVPALLRVAEYSDRWIRDPAHWVPSKENQWQSLLKHLFTRWEMPTYFESAWLTKGSLRHLDRDWYCDLAAGKNWRRLDYVPSSVTSRAVHLAMGAPNHLSIRQALRWGQLNAMNANPDLIEEVLQSKVVDNLSNEEIWSRLFSKVVGAREFDPRDFGVIADLFEGLYRTYQFHRARDLIRLPLPKLLSHCRKYWRRLLTDALADELKFKSLDIRESGLRRDLLHYSNAHWEPMDDIADDEIRYRARIGTITIWTVTQLTRHSQLVAEGLAMNHCVGGYRKWCQREESSIFSLKLQIVESGSFQYERKVTIEVYRPNRWVVQAKRRWNHDPEPLEMEVIQKWANRNKLTMWL